MYMCYNKHIKHSMAVYGGNDMHKYLGQLYLIIAASSWGGLYVVSKVVMDFIQPMELVWVRYLIALVILIAIGRIKGEKWKIDKKDIPLIVFIGICGYVLSIWAQFAGTQLSSAQTGSVITSASPAFMVLFAAGILHEKITLRKGFSVFLATIGVLLIVGIGPVDASFQLGAAILVLAAVTWALISVLIKKVPEHYSIRLITTYAMIAAALVMTPFELPQVDGAFFAALMNPVVLAGILYIGIIATALAFYFWNKGLQMVDASTGGIYFFFQPLVGTFLGWAFLGEPIGIPFLAGSALIIGSVVLVAWKQ